MTQVRKLGWEKQNRIASALRFFPFYLWMHLSMSIFLEVIVCSLLRNVGTARDAEVPILAISAPQRLRHTETSNRMFLHVE